MCVADDPAEALACADGTLTGCAQSCHRVCDIPTNLITDTCPMVQLCGSVEIDPADMTTLVTIVTGAPAGTSAVCFP